MAARVAPSRTLVRVSLRANPCVREAAPFRCARGAEHASSSWHCATWPACNTRATVRILRSHRQHTVGHFWLDAATKCRKFSDRSRCSEQIAQGFATLDPCDLEHALDFMG
jgi:hypothetical protein